MKEGATGADFVISGHGLERRSAGWRCKSEVSKRGGKVWGLIF